jgi:hypothetical protein
MKHLHRSFLVLLLGIVFGCSKNKNEIITDYFKALNTKDTNLLKKILMRTLVQKLMIQH